MKLILLSHPGTKKKELKVLTSLDPDVITAFHLRKPSWSFHEYKDFLQRLPERLLLKTVLNSHHELCHDFQLKGIHLTEKSRVKLEREQFDIPANARIISTSFHSLIQLSSSKMKFDYVFLSPVFDSISKVGYSAAFELDHLGKFLPRIRQNVIALGGINGSKIRLCYDLGFKGVAVLGAVWQSSDPLDAIVSLSRGIEKIKN